MALKSFEKSTAARLLELTPMCANHWEAVVHYLGMIPMVRVDEDHDDLRMAVARSLNEFGEQIAPLVEKALIHIDAEKARVIAESVPSSERVA
jgi:hypothetical protein